MRYCTSVIIYNLHAVGGLALAVRKLLKLGGYMGFATSVLHDVSIYSHI
jgi:hypothetical protein